MSLVSTTLVGAGCGSEPLSDTLRLDFQPDPDIFCSHTGMLESLREVTKDHPGGTFADSLDSVDVRPVEEQIQRAENKYVALDDEVGWVRRYVFV